MKRAFLEKIGGEWLDDFVYMSKQPLLEREFEVIEFDGDDMENTLLNHNFNVPGDIIIGSVQATVKFFEACGISTPHYLGYPLELKPYFGRKISSMYGSDLKYIKKPFFVKPSYDVKLFTGQVINNEFELNFLKEHYDLNDDTEVYVSSVVDIKSEWRCFVREGNLKGIQYYSGDFTLFPNVSTILTMIDKITESAPVSYTLDVGVIGDGNTILVEMNDMWAIGSYGFDSREYVLMCIRRMYQIFQKSLEVSK